MSERKKIVIATGIFPPDIGGPASYIRAIGGPLSEHADVHVVAFSSVRTHEGDEGLPYAVRRVWTRIPWGIRHVVFFLRCWAAARKADRVYVLNATTAGYTGSVAAWLAGKPTVVRIVGDYAWEMAVLKGRTYLMIDDFQESKKRGKTKRLDAMQKWVCGRAETIIVPSEYLSDLVMGWGIDEKKIVVVYNGSGFEPSGLGKEDARKEIGIAGNIILTSGRLVPWKGFRMLIKLMPQLFQVNQFFRLVIVGEGPQRDELQSMVRTLGLERKVFLVGKKTPRELAVYLAAADMFVLNTGYEGFSHQLLEALRACAPVITTAVGGNPELIEQGENGFLVKFNDEFNLVEAIKSLHRDPNIGRSFCEAGMKRAQEFTVERMLRETTKILLG